MGLDLTVRIRTDFKTDNKGRNSWTVMELGNLRNCWELLEGLQQEHELSNCTTISLYGEDFYRALEYVQGEGEKQFINNFLKENSIENTDANVYEVHAWW